MPAKWKYPALGSFSELVQYGTSFRCDASIDGVPVLRIPNILNGRIASSELKYLRRDFAPPNLSLHRGDVLFVRTNAKRENTGRCAVYRGEPVGALFASYLIRVRPNRQVVPEFLQIFASSEMGRRQLAGRASRAADGKFNINSQTIKTMIVPVPSVDEQRAIMEAVEAVDSRIYAAERKLKALASLSQALIHTLIDLPQQRLNSKEK
jgi:type I restriction enzyme S subunit